MLEHTQRIYRIAMIAMVLAVMQATPPIPRKAADTIASPGYQKKHTRESEVKPSLPSNPPVGQVSVNPQVETENAAIQKTKKKQETVFIGELATVSWPWLTNVLNIVYVLATIAIAVVGYFGIKYAKETLGHIERQTRANEGQLTEIKAAGEQTKQMIAHAETQAQAGKDAADAALKNATALMNAERAWILVTMLPTGPRKKQDIGASVKYVWEDGRELTDDDIVNGKELVPETIGFVAKNYGRTPGWVTSIWANARIIPVMNGLPHPPLYFIKGASINIEKCDALYAPEADRKSRIFIPADDLIPVAERESFLYVYGIIHYRDVWGEKHETRFCFYWHVPVTGELNPPDFYQEGPEGYNGQT
jgi:hypothetical protein